MALLECEHGEDTLCGRLFSAGHTRICGVSDSLGVCSKEVARGERPYHHLETCSGQGELKSDCGFLISD